MKRFNLTTAQSSTGQLREWLYNTVDCIATRHVSDTLLGLMDETAMRYYNFEMASQGPAVAMMNRGILIDVDARTEAVTELKKEMKHALKEIDKHPVIQEHWDGLQKVTGKCKQSTRADGRHTWEKGVEDTPERHCVSCGRSRFERAPFNPNSPDQVSHLFYEILGVKKQYDKTGKVSTDKEALARIGRQNKRYLDLTQQILDAKGIQKSIGWLNTRLSPDNRFMSTFSIGTAWTGRWSAHENPFKEGGNAQNVTEKLRYVFIADPGCELVYADLKQAESNLVAHLAGDEAYIEAHVLGDVHTYVTRLVWPELPWVWEINQDKKIAGALPPWDYVPGHSYRFQSKRVQHGSNYLLTPFGIAIIAHIPVKEARTAQRRYFQAFPGIRVWQRNTQALIHAQKPLMSPLGFRFKLFGRPLDDHTVKQGVSVLPQGTVAHIIAIGAWRIWQTMDAGNKPMKRGQNVQLLAQIHDALLFQRLKGDDEATRKALNLMRVPVPITGADGKTRTAIIETEAAAGENWGHFNDRPLDREGKPQRLNLKGIKEIEL